MIVQQFWGYGLFLCQNIKSYFFNIITAYQVELFSGAIEYASVPFSWVWLSNTWAEQLNTKVVNRAGMQLIDGCSF